ncbi:hypothetical protein KR018_012615, partial [Drosophila ironensis]
LAATIMASSYVIEFQLDEPPSDAVSSLKFSPYEQKKCFLAASSWDGSVHYWEVESPEDEPEKEWSEMDMEVENGTNIHRGMKRMGGPIMDVCWSQDGTKIFAASCDHTVMVWDLASDKIFQVATHSGPVRTCDMIVCPNYSCLMTGSLDKTVKFWDLRAREPSITVGLPDICYGADVAYPKAALITAGKKTVLFSLNHGPIEEKTLISSHSGQNRCVTFVKEGMDHPIAIAIGNTEGKANIQYLATKKEFDLFGCHIHNSTQQHNTNDKYSVNDITQHPIHSTLATVGSDGIIGYFSTEDGIEIKRCESKGQAITACDFSSDGKLLAYAMGYDWSKSHETYDSSKMPQICVRLCAEEAQN